MSIREALERKHTRAVASLADTTGAPIDETAPALEPSEMAQQAVSPESAEAGQGLAMAQDVRMQGMVPALRLAPSLGGFVGGSLGSPLGAQGRIGAAGLGGMLGGGVEQAGLHMIGAPGAPATLQEAAQRSVGAGAGQAGYEAAGGLFASGISAVGRGLVSSAIGRKTMQVFRKQFPDVKLIDVLLEHRLPVGRLFKGREGSAIAADLQKLADQEADKLYANASRIGFKVDPTLLTTRVKALIQEVGQVSEKEMKTVQGWTQSFLDRNPGPLSPTRVHKINRTFRDRAAAAKAELRRRWYRAIADDASEALTSAVPGSEAAELASRKMAAASEAIAEAEARAAGTRLPMAAAAGVALTSLPKGVTPKEVGGAALAFLLARAAQSPRLQSRAGLLLTTPAVREATRQTPRGLGAIYDLAREE